MKKIASFLCLLSLISLYGFSQSNEVSLTVEVTNIKAGGGKVYLALFSNAESFKKEEPEFAYELSDASTVATQSVSIPAGDYIVSAFQDANNNQKLDYNLIGIPREIVGISNYNGKGFPSKDFNKQKVPITSSTGKVSIQLYKF